MSTLTIAKKLELDGSLIIPTDFFKGMNLQAGDTVQVRVESINLLDIEQEKLQLKFESFFDRLDQINCNSERFKTNASSGKDLFSEAMDEKFHKQGFRP